MKWREKKPEEKEEEERSGKKAGRGLNAGSSAPRSTAPSSAPSALAPSPLQAVCPWPGARRHSLWRRAKGPFLEFFPPGVYLRETFEKGLKSKKFGVEAN